ncbi:uncharacterized protein [Elaeis guineensis]|uniref:Uncharacterized protein LOC105034963 isoform X1 n=1 Tax=Elaeis guineensis var. tenera TaxID=51953 RepID=A0A6I9QFN0_ELAGV|nr:uncharacterized protein LOC105034963 isoform X1 [Elaeis guineensis]
MKAPKKSAVLYHYPCPDGAFAALAAHLYFSATSQPVLFFPNTVYDPIRVDTLPLEMLSDVYLLDFVGPPGFVAEISSKVESVTILDHHKTALETLHGNASIGNNVTKVMDMKRSGATIAFDFFSEKLLARSNISENYATGSNAVAGAKFLPDGKFERVGRLFRYIEDADLWRWALPYSKAFSSGLKDMNIEYNINVNSVLFDQLLELDPEHVIAHGQETLSHKQRLIDEVLEQSYEIALGSGLFGHCLAVDADSILNLRCELGHQLAIKSHNLKLRGIGAVVYKVPELGDDQMLKVSLRSVDTEDTTPISQEYGGGGHQNASSFMLRAVEFETWKVQTEPLTQAND